MRHARVVVLAAFVDLLAEDLEEVVVADALLHFADVVDDDVGEDQARQAAGFVVLARLDRELAGVARPRGRACG